ncbi:hypothetical protein PTI98_007306 [Pleurotus ostreatus]|nr:hypothetical protein PTI98_007306 [Pleurotus ostreatus]
MHFPADLHSISSPGLNMFPPFQVALSTLLVHTAMYTTYLHIHCTSLYIFKQRKNRTSNPLPILLTSTTLFALITTQWVLTIVDTVAFFEATLLTSHSNILPYALVGAIFNGPHGTVKILLYVAQTAIGDGFFVHHSSFTHELIHLSSISPKGLSTISGMGQTMGSLDLPWIVHTGSPSIGCLLLHT